jgi:hypothetical protein
MFYDYPPQRKKAPSGVRGRCNVVVANFTTTAADGKSAPFGALAAIFDSPCLPLRLKSL